MLIEVQVKTKSAHLSLVKTGTNKYRADLISPPHDDLANKELIKLIAGNFCIAKSLIRIKSGRRSKTKLLEIEIQA